MPVSFDWIELLRRAGISLTASYELLARKLISVSFSLKINMGGEMRLGWFFYVLALCGFIGSAQADVSDWPEDYAAAIEFQKALSANDYEAVSKLIDFPIRMPAPLANILTPEEFSQHWTDFFDETTIPKYLEAEPEEVGWRGIMLAGGCIWFNEGKISSITCHTPNFDERWKAEKEAEWGNLYPSARGYDDIQYSCHTDKLNVRVQNHGDDMRYFAWKKGSPLATKPELEMHNGLLEHQGTGGNYTMTFKNGHYKYEIYVSKLCGEDCNDYLRVYKNDEIISRKICEVPPY